MQVSAHDEDQRADALAAAAFDALDETELVESLWIEDEFGEAALDPLVDAWCLSVDSPAEITSNQAPAAVTASLVVHLPNTNTRDPLLTRSAA